MLGLAARAAMGAAAIGLIGAVGLFGAACSGDREVDTVTSGTTGIGGTGPAALPLIDLQAPTTFETATFAFG